ILILIFFLAASTIEIDVWHPLIELPLATLACQLSPVASAVTVAVRTMGEATGPASGAGRALCSGMTDWPGSTVHFLSLNLGSFWMLTSSGFSGARAASCTAGVGICM